jgi:hypothetical protein
MSELKDNLLDGEYLITKEYTEWLVKTGGFARDKTLRDEFAGQAMDKCPLNNHTDAAAWCYARADAMLKERAK